MKIKEGADIWEECEDFYDSDIDYYNDKVLSMKYIAVDKLKDFIRRNKMCFGRTPKGWKEAFEHIE